MLASSSRVLRFDRFTLDLKGCILRDGDEERELRRQSFGVLRHLAERSGEVVSRDELIEAVWVVEPARPEDSVAQCIKEIRRALGDDARWIVRTVPGRGYALMAEVTAAEVAPPSISRSSLDTHAGPVRTPVREHRSDLAPSHWLRNSIAGGLATLVLAGTGWLVWQQVSWDPEHVKAVGEARPYHPHDRRRRITPGGQVTCGRNGCQTVPEGCFAVRGMGGGGLGGKIFCHQQPEVTKAAEDTSAAVEPPIPAGRTAFDGTWQVRRLGPSCLHFDVKFIIEVTEGVVRGRVPVGPISGEVSSSGQLVFKHPGSMGDGATLNYSAVLKGATGSGTFKYPGNRCGGTITLVRN